MFSVKGVKGQDDPATEESFNDIRDDHQMVGCNQMIEEPQRLVSFEPQVPCWGVGLWDPILKDNCVGILER